MKIYGDKIYEHHFLTRGWGKYPPEEVIRFFMFAREKLGYSGLKALDIGCGIGACSWFMAKEGAIVTAMDGAPSGIKNVNKLAREFGVDAKIEIIHGDITKPKRFLTSAYDILLDSYAVYSNPEENAINGFREFFDLLNAGGFFLTCCFGKKTTGFGTGQQLSENTFCDIETGCLANGGIQTFFSREKLTQIFKDIGYWICYYEHILQDRSGVILEKHITCLAK